MFDYFTRPIVVENGKILNVKIKLFEENGMTALETDDPQEYYEAVKGKKVMVYPSRLAFYKERLMGK